MGTIKEIKLYDADTLEYSGTIRVVGNDWEYQEVNNQHLISTTRGMPLKVVLRSLMYFNLVYDELEQEH